MAADSQLIIVEQLLPERAEAGAFAFLGNMDLVVNFAGRLRTAGEFADLLRSAGLDGASFTELSISGGPAWVAIKVDRKMSVADAQTGSDH